MDKLELLFDCNIRDDDRLKAIYLAKLADEHRLLNVKCHEGTKHFRLGYAHWYECSCGWKTTYSN